MSNTEPTKKPRMNSDAREGQAVLASYKTPAVLLIYTVKSGKIPDNDTGREPIIAKYQLSPTCTLLASARKIYGDFFQTTIINGDKADSKNLHLYLG